MPTSRRTLLKNSAAAAAAFSLDWTRAQAQAETLRIGVIYDLTGPFAAGGSVASSIGAQIAIDLVNEKGGIGGKYKVAPIAADSQSKPDVAINEAESPDRPGEDRHHQRRLCELARGPARGQGRAAEEDPLDHDRGFDRRVQGQEPAIRVPRADSLRSVRPGLCELPHRTCQGKARDRAQGRQGRADPRRRPLRRRRCRRRRGLFQAGRHSRSCSRKVIRRPRPTSRCW